MFHNDLPNFTMTLERISGIDNKIDAQKERAFSFLEELAHAVQSGAARFGHSQAFKTPSGYTILGEEIPAFWAGALLYSFQIDCVGGREVEADHELSTILANEIEAWGWNNPSELSVPSDPLLSDALTKALERRYETFRSVLLGQEKAPKKPALVVIVETERVSDAVDETLVPPPAEKEPVQRPVPRNLQIYDQPRGSTGAFPVFVVVTLGAIGFFAWKDYEIFKERAHEEDIIAHARTPLDVLCANAVPGEYKLVSGKDVFKDNKDGSFDLRLLQGGVVLASMAGSVPEDCIKGKLFASFTDFPTAQLVVSEGVSAINSFDLGVGEPRLATYRFTPTQSSALPKKACPDPKKEHLPFPERLGSGPYNGTVNATSYSWELIDVSLHHNKGSTTTVGWLYTNWPDKIGGLRHNSCAGYFSDQAALDARTQDEKNATDYRYNMGWYK